MASKRKAIDDGAVTREIRPRHAADEEEGKEEEETMVEPWYTHGTLGQMYMCPHEDARLDDGVIPKPHRPRLITGSMVGTFAGKSWNFACSSPKLNVCETGLFESFVPPQGLWQISPGPTGAAF